MGPLCLHCGGHTVTVLPIGINRICLLPLLDLMVVNHLQEPLRLDIVSFLFHLHLSGFALELVPVVNAFNLGFKPRVGFCKVSVDVLLVLTSNGVGHMINIAPVDHTVLL